MQPVNLGGELRRVLKNADPLKIPDIDVDVRLNDLECFVSQKSLKLLFAILNENLNEGGGPPPPPTTTKKPPAALHPPSGEADRVSLSKRLSIGGGIKSTHQGSYRKLSMPQIIQEESEAAAVAPEFPERVNMKLFVDLKRIKLIIVELTSNKEAANSTAVDDDVPNVSASSLSSSSGDESGKQLRIRRVNNNAYKIVDFSSLEIQDIDFDYAKHDDLSWLAVFKMKELHLNDIRPDSNLAVKEYVLLEV